MADPDIDDSFEDDSFDDDDDARLVDDDASGRSRASSLEKRRLIDNLLEEDIEKIKDRWTNSYSSTSTYIRTTNGK